MKANILKITSELYDDLMYKGNREALLDKELVKEGFDMNRKWFVSREINSMNIIFIQEIKGEADIEREYKKFLL
ncbi:MAG: hypothetical protein KAS04_04595 [Candidatus Aenigmarchaeota archaeon]|nr:hypothetical protein [Candidatus Aenigmarchaeota archaeon]